MSRPTDTDFKRECRLSLLNGFYSRQLGLQQDWARVDESFILSKVEIGRNAAEDRDFSLWLIFLLMTSIVDTATLTKIKVLRVINLLLLILTVSSSAPVHAQLNSGNLSQLTEKDGLPSNLINSVLVDKLGYVWVASPNGLVRYNGYEFQRFYSNPNDSAAIHGTIVYSMIQDRGGKIWMGTNPSYIECYDPATGSFSAISFEKKYSGKLAQAPMFGFVVSSICEATDGTLYFGIQTRTDEDLPFGLLFKKPNEDSLHIYNSPEGKNMGPVYRIRKDPSGKLWIVAREGIFTIDNKGTFQDRTALFLNLRFRPSDFMVDFQFDRAGHAWILSYFGSLIRFNVQSGTLTTFTSSQHRNPYDVKSSTLAIDSSGIIWIGREEGIEQYLPQDDQFRVFNTGNKKDLEKTYVNSFAFDDFGNVFIGTGNDGLLRYEQKPVFTSIFSTATSFSNGLKTGWADYLFEASDGNIWIHTDSGIAYMKPKPPYPVYAINNPNLQNSHLTECWEEKPGIFIIAQVKGPVLKYNIASDQVDSITLPGVPAGTAIFKYLKDEQGNIWLGARSGLYRRSAGADTFRRYDLSGLEGCDDLSNSVSDLVKSSIHGLWIITNNGLFRYRYDTDRIVREGFGKQKDEVFITQDINSFCEDEKGGVWVGLWQGGLANYNPDTRKVISYTVDDGLPSMGIQGLVEDGKGYIWISSFNGISRFDRVHKIFSNFSTEDGVQGTLFADASYLKTSAGIIIFGGSNGITLFNPDDFDSGYSKPKVYLTDLKLFGKSLYPGKDAILKEPIYAAKEAIFKYNQNNLAIDFLAIHYSNPQKNRYAYILENYDSEWRETVNQREAFYPNLPPGEYVFRVKAASDKGIWNEEGASLIIVVKSPWWQTWWAYALYIIATAILIIGFIRWRTAYLQKEKKSLEKKVAERTDELKTSLENLKATQGQLIQKEKMASLGELTAGIAHEIQNPLNFVNNFSELSKELIYEMKIALENGEDEEAEELADDITKNLEKINYHGRRADAIVKGMLQHSRKSEGVAEDTDINALTDEYLRLAYHGIRAKDSNFKSDFKTSYDRQLPKIKMVPQDVGRAILNIISNAFYAVNEKRRSSNGSYHPEVMISTERVEDKVQLIVADNGTGIPSSVVEKIFQPFFTTKPTGEGTGLGLSLAYDIITKAHGGELNVKTVEGEGSIFTIKLGL